MVRRGRRARRLEILVVDASPIVRHLDAIAALVLNLDLCDTNNHKVIYFCINFSLTDVSQRRRLGKMAERKGGRESSTVISTKAYFAKQQRNVRFKAHS